MATKTERIDLRVPPELKELITEASEVAGMSLSAFIAAAAQELAVRVMRTRQAVILSDRDRDRFLAALDRPVRSIPETVRKAKARCDAHLAHG